MSRAEELTEIVDHLSRLAAERNLVQRATQSCAQGIENLARLDGEVDDDYLIFY